MTKKSFLLLIIISISVSLLPAQSLPQLHFNPWKLIIYRSENTSDINEIKCFIKIEDTQDNDVTYSCASATYEWVTIPNVINYYQKSYYLLGGMAMHLNIKPGKYYISFYTPQDSFTDYRGNINSDWQSNRLFYDTDNPAKVIFVYPEADDNGFYSGKWFVSYKAPLFYKNTKPKL